MKNFKLFLILCLIILPVLASSCQKPPEAEKKVTAEKVEEQTEAVKAEQKESFKFDYDDPKVKEDLDKLKDLKGRHEYLLSQIKDNAYLEGDVWAWQTGQRKWQKKYDGISDKNSDEAKEISAKLKDNLKREKRALNKPETSECYQLLNDFIAGEAQLILPIIHTHNYKDEELQKYIGQCPNLKDLLAEKYTVDARTGTYLDEKYKNDPEKLMKAYKEESIIQRKFTRASMNYQLYKLDYVDNVNNGNEYILFSGGYINPVTKESYHLDDYDIFSLKECKYFFGADSTARLYDPIEKKIKDNYTGIIKYKNKYYIYEVDNRYLGKISFITWKPDFHGVYKNLVKCSFIKVNKEGN